MMHTTPVPLMSGQVTNPQSIMPEPLSMFGNNSAQPSMFDNQNSMFGSVSSLGKYAAQHSFDNANPQPNPSDFGQSLHPQSWRLPQQLEQVNQSLKQKPKYWETAPEGKKIYDNVIHREGDIHPMEQSFLEYLYSALQSSTDIAHNYITMRGKPLTDKYKHAYMNCEAAQYGEGGRDVAKFLSNLKEWKDVNFGSNTLDSSQADQYANKIGRLLGTKYLNGNCDELVQEYIKKNY